ncbi:hypothetical protein GCM10023161_33550 [Mycobacterium paraffinicum]|uniref:FAD-binding domain-containing protein n=1 Tax=Mycobacterium paraffinicum TaxID=53378 RepID=A0ABP8EZ14_9MYCO
MTDEHADIVISGAGPNGLLLACELALAGIRPVVLDALPGPSSEPKANGLVGQVVRTLDMRGLYREFTGDPNPPQPVYGWIFAAMTLDFSGLPDSPMYVRAAHSTAPSGAATGEAGPRPWRGSALGARTDGFGSGAGIRWGAGVFARA